MAVEKREAEKERGGDREIETGREVERERERKEEMGAEQGPPFKGNIANMHRRCS